jgi:hypothetical protein
MKWHFFFLSLLALLISPGRSQTNVEKVEPSSVRRGDKLLISGISIPEEVKSAAVELSGSESREVGSVQIENNVITAVVPDDLALGAYTVRVKVPKEGGLWRSVNSTSTARKGLVIVTTNENLPVEIEAVNPAVVSPEKDGKTYRFTIIGKGFSTRAGDSVIEVVDQGSFDPKWVTVTSAREIEVSGIPKDKFQSPLKLRVRVGDNVSGTKDISLSRVDKGSPLKIGLAILAVIVVAMGAVGGSMGKATTASGLKLGFIERLLLDAETETYSLSKFQFYLWTFVGIFAYVYIMVAKSLVQGKFEFVDIPAGLPGIIFASAGTTVLAQGIAGNRGKGAGSLKPSFADFVTTGGVVAVERFQFLVWTLLGAGTYVFLTLMRDPAVVEGAPTIPEGFLYLMGISSAGYLGGKFTRKPGPVIDETMAVEGSLRLEIRGRNLSKDAIFHIADTKIEVEREKEAGSETKAKPLGTKNKLKVLTKQDDPQHPDFAKVLILELDTEGKNWGKEKTKLRLTNPDGQYAEDSFEVKKESEKKEPPKT